MEDAVEPAGDSSVIAATSHRRDDGSKDGANLNSEDVQFSKDQFYKTKLCIPFASGLCRRGKTCCFAHGEAELREPLNLSKTKLCQAWISGSCTRPASQCTFAHGEDDLRATADYYKTGLCKFWKRGIPCEAGADCRHAHGQDEIRERSYRRTERDKREAKTPSKSGSEDVDLVKSMTGRSSRRHSKSTDISSEKPANNSVKPIRKISSKMLSHCSEKPSTTENWENGLENLEAVVDELLIDSTSFQQCHSMSSPALATNAIMKVSSPALATRSSPWLGTLTNVMTDFDSTSDMHGYNSTIGSSQGQNSPAFTVENLLNRPTAGRFSPPFAAATSSHRDRPSKKPPLYIVTEGNPEFDPESSVTIIIDGECVKCNVEEVHLMRSSLSMNSQPMNAAPVTTPAPRLGSSNYRLSDILQLLDPHEQ